MRSTHGETAKSEKNDKKNRPVKNEDRREAYKTVQDPPNVHQVEITSELRRHRVKISPETLAKNKNYKKNIRQVPAAVKLAPKHDSKVKIRTQPDQPAASRSITCISKEKESLPLTAFTFSEMDSGFRAGVGSKRD
ncbi:hypothetical protein HK102_003634 [Quaeritorhiza haematococci]|nr:hypothetical protein HK102_003634 [Quaeritorhiza haematococci]